MENSSDNIPVENEKSQPTTDRSQYNELLKLKHDISVKMAIVVGVMFIVCVVGAFLLGSTMAEGEISLIYIDNYSEQLQKAAEHGDAWAQYKLGWCYGNGYGASQDYAKAVEWWRKAAKQGDAQAQYNLALCYDEGHGVPPDYGKAVEWWQRAAEQGDAWAQYKLGECYEKGHGVTRDKEKAMEWYQKSADQGNSEAVNNCLALFWNEKAEVDSVRIGKSFNPDDLPLLDRAI